MAAILQPQSGGRRGARRARRYRPLAEINVTPFVDVMLVLLIVFMVTAPLLTVGVPVDLPKTEASALSQPTEPLVLSIASDGKVYVQELAVPVEELAAKLVAVTGNKLDTRIYVRGDRTVAYGDVMRVMGVVASAGFAEVALVAELPSERGG